MGSTEAVPAANLLSPSGTPSTQLALVKVLSFLRTFNQPRDIHSRFGIPAAARSSETVILTKQTQHMAADWRADTQYVT